MGDQPFNNLRILNLRKSKLVTYIRINAREGNGAQKSVFCGVLESTGMHRGEVKVCHHPRVGKRKDAAAIEWLPVSTRKKE
jgi:hypothetical protein